MHPPLDLPLQAKADLESQLAAATGERDRLQQRSAELEVRGRVAEGSLQPRRRSRGHPARMVPERRQAGGRAGGRGAWQQRAPADTACAGLPRCCRASSTRRDRARSRRSRTSLSWRSMPPAWQLSWRRPASRCVLTHPRSLPACLTCFLFLHLITTGPCRRLACRLWCCCCVHAECQLHSSPPAQLPCPSLSRTTATGGRGPGVGGL